jgi:hypothetical protein
LGSCGNLRVVRALTWVNGRIVARSRWARFTVVPRSIWCAYGARIWYRGLGVCP